MKNESRRVDIKVSSAGQKKNCSVEMSSFIVVEMLPQTLDEAAANRSEVGNWKHLKGMETSEGQQDVILLIGLYAPQALVPLDVRRGDNYEPFAIRMVLGCTFLGPMGTDRRSCLPPLGLRNLEATQT